MNEKTVDERFMRQCFALALKAEGRTAPNPVVGAVVVQNGKVVGTGFHPKSGQPHAEVFAIDEAGAKAEGATIYVSLEPCCHHGKTPPCTDKVIASGIKRVVAAMTDPNPKVAGQGFEKLLAAGIEVVPHVLEAEAKWHNRAFVKTITTGMPWVTLKIATTLDGKIADRNGTSKWITGPEARRFVHKLRNKLDCVLVGAKTARTDDPELNVRELDEFRHPKRAVVDTNLTIEPDSRLCQSGTGGDTIVYCSETALAGRDKLPASVQTVAVPVSTNGNAGRLDLKHVLRDLKTKGVSSVLCEGGGVLAGSLIDEDLVDEIIWIVAPAVLGDPEAIPGVSISHPIELKNLKRFNQISSNRIGDDTMIRLTRERFEGVENLSI